MVFRLFFVIFKCMSTTIFDHATVSFTFLLVMWFAIIIDTSCALFLVALCFLLQNLKSGLLVVIFIPIAISDLSDLRYWIDSYLILKGMCFKIMLQDKFHLSRPFSTILWMVYTNKNKLNHIFENLYSLKVLRSGCLKIFLQSTQIYAAFYRVKCYIEE